MKISTLCHVFAFAAISNLILVSAITKTREADVLNLNGIQDGDVVTERGLKGPGKGKDPAVTESQENRSFFKPDADRRGSSFYPSGPPLSPGSSFGSNPYHTSGNGYSYGSPSAPSDYPPPSPTYGGSYPGRPTGGPGGPGSSPGGLGGFTGHSGYGGGFGGGYPLAPSGGGHSHAMLKGLLLPIAGVALLGAAAVLAKTNPVLLQLGVVSGKRRRREVRGEYPENPFVRPNGY